VSTALDIGISLFVLAAAITGWQLGFVRSALPLAGFIGGAILGGRLGPALLAGGSDSRYAAVIALLVALFAGAVGASLMDVVATRLGSGRLRVGLAAFLDAAGGTALLVALALLVSWAFSVVVLQATAPGSHDLRRAFSDSKVLTALNDELPPSGILLNVLRRVDPAPTVHAPNAQVPAPDSKALHAAAARRAERSVVKVIGTACGLGLEGSGWVAKSDLVVTNAHVVAGEDDTQVVAPGGATFDATVVHYEPGNDLAILRVDGLGLPALGLHPVASGASAAIVGYPENGPLTATAARVGRTGTVRTQDSYGRGPVNRQVTPFRGLVRSGNSGGPVVDASGRVAATVFAANQSGPAGGLGVPDAAVAKGLRGRLENAGTGPCIA
jgi:S1-C subfamily serine protease